MRQKNMEVIKKNLYEKTWKVPSKSSGKTYEVALFREGKYKCQCVASRMGVECSHIKMVKIWKK